MSLINLKIPQFKFLLINFSVSTLLLFSCTPQRKISGNYSYKTECLGVEGDGTQTLLSWGAGRNRLDAVEQAKKKCCS